MDWTARNILAVLTLGLASTVHGQFEYITNADNTTLTITGYIGGVPSALIIPAVINSLPVSGIGDAAFSGDGMTSVAIPDSVTNIGEEAFESCSILTKVSISDSVASISAYTFSSTALTSVTIPDGVTNIGDGAFLDCSDLTNAVIPDSLVSLGSGAFNLAALTSIAVPAGVTNCGYDPFGCVSLTNVTISYGLTSIGMGMFAGCPSVPYITIPASVTNIEEQAFLDCSNLTQVYFMGDAPAVDPTSFQNVHPGGCCSGPTDYYVTMAYYLAGTIGWAEFSSNAMIPAVLWNPLIQATGANFGVQSNQFGFDITGTTNIPIVVQACTDLAQSVWVSLQSMTLTNGLVHFSEPLRPNTPARFYRIGAP